MKILDVIQCEMTSDDIAEKFPSDNIRLGSQLIVRQAQTAIFVVGGQVCDVFTSGTYTLDTKNLPILGSLLNIPFGGETPFKAEVWFINLVSMLDCRWGTPAPIQIEDKKYKVLVPVKAFGQYGFRITDARLLFENLIGTMQSMIREELESYMQGFLLSSLTDTIANVMAEEDKSVVNINQHARSLSQRCKAMLSDRFAAYGIELMAFHIMAINVDANDASYIRLKETIDALAKYNLMGEDKYKLTRTFDIMEKAAAENDGMGAGIGLGAGIGIGGQLGKMALQAIGQSASSSNSAIGVYTFAELCNMFSEGKISQTSKFILISDNQ